MLHNKASFVQYFMKQIVQFRSGRFKGSLHVLPGTLWTYVLTPSRRTCKHPLNVRPQSQGRTSIGFFAGEIDVLQPLAFICSLSGVAYLQTRPDSLVFIAFSGRSRMSKRKLNTKKTDPNDTCGYHLWAKSIKVGSINCSAFFRNSDLVLHPK